MSTRFDQMLAKRRKASRKAAKRSKPVAACRKVDAALASHQGKLFDLIAEDAPRTHEGCFFRNTDSGCR